MRAEALGDQSTLASRLDNSSSASIDVPAATSGGLERIADVPIYAVDSIVRRAASLQATADAAARVVGLPSALWQQLGARVIVKQGDASATLAAREDATLAANTVRVSAPLGAMFGAITVEKAPA